MNNNNSKVQDYLETFQFSEKLESIDNNELSTFDNHEIISTVENIILLWDNYYNILWFNFKDYSKDEIIELKKFLEKIDINWVNLNLKFKWINLFFSEGKIIFLPKEVFICEEYLNYNNKDFIIASVHDPHRGHTKKVPYVLDNNNQWTLIKGPEQLNINETYPRHYYFKELEFNEWLVFVKYENISNYITTWLLNYDNLVSRVEFSDVRRLWSIINSDINNTFNINGNYFFTSERADNGLLVLDNKEFIDLWICSISKIEEVNWKIFIIWKEKSYWSDWIFLYEDKKIHQIFFDDLDNEDFNFRSFNCEEIFDHCWKIWFKVRFNVPKKWDDRIFLLDNNINSENTNLTPEIINRPEWVKLITWKVNVWEKDFFVFDYGESWFWYIDKNNNWIGMTDFSMNDSFEYKEINWEKILVANNSELYNLTIDDSNINVSKMNTWVNWSILEINCINWYYFLKNKLYNRPWEVLFYSLIKDNDFFEFEYDWKKYRTFYIKEDNNGKKYYFDKNETSVILSEKEFFELL